MKQLDIIHLRLAGSHRENLIDTIRKSVCVESDQGTVRFYGNAKVSTDLSIHIHLKTRTQEHAHSELGTRLAAALQEFGLVEHTVWIEDKPEPDKSMHQ